MLYYTHISAKNKKIIGFGIHNRETAEYIMSDQDRLLAEEYCRDEEH